MLSYRKEIAALFHDEILESQHHLVVAVGRRDREQAVQIWTVLSVGIVDGLYSATGIRYIGAHTTPIWKKRGNYHNFKYCLYSQIT